MSYGLIINHPYNVKCPFVKEAYESYDEGGPGSVMSWRPGVRWDHVPPDSSEPVADGLGLVTYTIVSIHKLPAPYPARVFFTRKWTDPNGRQFGKSRLHVMIVSAFKRRLQAYKFAGYDDAQAERDFIQIEESPRDGLDALIDFILDDQSPVTAEDAADIDMFNRALAKAEAT